jgi:hypothetical protein
MNDYDGAACARRPRAGERGGAGLNFLLVMCVLAALAYAGFQLAPSFYYGSAFGTLMQDTVDTAAVTDKPPAWVEQQLRAALPDHGIPPQAAVTATVRDGRMEARVQYQQPIPLVVTQYDYKFDRTVRSATATTVTH